MNENHVAKQNFEEPSAAIPHARICGSTGGVIPGATQPLKMSPGLLQSCVWYCKNQCRMLMKLTQKSCRQFEKLENAEKRHINFIVIKVY